MTRVVGCCPVPKPLAGVITMEPGTASQGGATVKDPTEKGAKPARVSASQSVSSTLQLTRRG